MIPTWKTEEIDKKSKKWAKMAQKWLNMAQNSAILPPEKPRNPTL